MDLGYTKSPVLVSYPIPRIASTSAAIAATTPIRLKACTHHTTQERTLLPNSSRVPIINQ